MASTVAIDGQTLAGTVAMDGGSTSHLFHDAYGGQADEIWAAQHNRDLGFSDDPNRVFSTVNGTRSLQQLANELRNAGYPGPWGSASLQAAYARTAGGTVTPIQTAAPAPAAGNTNTIPVNGGTRTGGDQSAQTGANIGSQFGKAGQVLGAPFRVGGVSLPLFVWLGGGYLAYSQFHKRHR